MIRMPALLSAGNPDEWEDQMRINFLAPMRLVRWLGVNLYAVVALIAFLPSMSALSASVILAALRFTVDVKAGRWLVTHLPSNNLVHHEQLYKIQATVLACVTFAPRLCLSGCEGICIASQLV